MNKIRVRVIIAIDRSLHLQVSTDNQVWFTIKVNPDKEAGETMIAEAKWLFDLTSNSHAMATHILWKSKNQ